VDYSQDSWAFEVLKLCLGRIKVTGLNTNQIPAVTNMPHFLNQSICLKNAGQTSDWEEVQFLAGVVMISTKRYVQAGEIFRKVQAVHLEHIKSLTAQLK